MNTRGLRRRCEALVAQLDIPTPFDIDVFCRQLGHARNRPIHLLPMAMPATAPCGLWLAGEHIDYIVYEQHTSPVHQRHIVLHEVGHLLWRHAAPADETRRPDLFSSLSPDTVRHILARTSYRTEEEQEAELVATLILQRADRPVAPPPHEPTAAEATVLTRLAAALQHQRRGRRRRGGHRD